MSGQDLWAEPKPDTVEVVYTLLGRPEWHSRAACRGRTAEMFPTTRSHGRRWRDAVAICVGCPVIEECAAAAEANGEVHGVWGGVRRSATNNSPNIVSEMGVDSPSGDGWWTVEQLADLIGHSRYWVRKRMKHLSELGAVDAGWHPDNRSVRIYRRADMARRAS